MRTAGRAGILAGAALVAAACAWTALRDVPAASAPAPIGKVAAVPMVPAAPSAPAAPVALPDAPVHRPTTDDPRTVLVLYRRNCPDLDGDGMGDSEEIARYYAERRGIPKNHLLGIRVDLPGDPDVRYKYLAWPMDAFQRELVRPLQDKLRALGPERILYIVTTFGMPARLAVTDKRTVAADAALACPFLVREDGPHLRPFYELPPGRRYAAPRFSEVRAQRKPGGMPDDLGYLVGRLDGVSAPFCKALVDEALYAETYSIDGYAYVDTRYAAYTDEELAAWAKGPRYITTSDVDKSIALTRLFFRAAGLPVRQQPDNDVIGEPQSPGLAYTDGTPATQAPRALMYAGWYNYGRYYDAFEWLPGSVAVDFDSISLFAPGQLGQSFGGMALFSGASGVAGAFAEPYTTGHPMPDILASYYMRGYNFAEASWLSMPTRPFVVFAIGDPLMNPYGRERRADTGIAAPNVSLRRDGKTLRARVEITGEAEIARATMVVAEKRDDSMLPAPTRRDGPYMRAFDLSAPLPAKLPAQIGVVVRDPAGHTTRVWQEWKG